MDRMQHLLKRKRECAEKRRLRKEKNNVTMMEARKRQELQAHELGISVREVREVRKRDYNLEGEAFHYDLTQEYNKLQQVIIGKMDQVCQFCDAKKFSRETPGMCCMKGKVRLTSLEVRPPELFRCMTGETSESKHFLQNVRAYNACFQMTSFGPTYRTSDANSILFFQLENKSITEEDHYCHYRTILKIFCNYFIDNEQIQLHQRCQNISGLRREIIEDLQRILHKYNQLVYVFKIALDRMVSDEYKVVIRADKRPVGEHAPQVNEIAIVIVDSEYTSRDIIIQRRKKAYNVLQKHIVLMMHFNIR